MLGAIAAAPDGSLLMVEWASGKTPTRIVRLNPATGAVTTVSAGGKLKTPNGLAVAPSGDLIVADGTSGILRIAPSTGAQSTIGAVTGATAVALDAGGSIYVTVPGPPPVLKAAAKARQRVSLRKIQFSASCSPRCLLRYDLRYTGITYKDDDSSDVGRVSAKKAFKRLTPTFITRQIRSALRKHRTVKAKLVLTPVSTTGGGDGKSITLTVRIVS